MPPFKPIRTAIFPVAGLGFNFLPVTKTMPSEMLQIIDRPLIQYALNEAREAGIEQFVLVTGRGKTSLAEYFGDNFELEYWLNERKHSSASLQQTRIEAGQLVTVPQQYPLGLGHAIWCAREVVGNEPFAVILPDELMVGSPGCMAKMVEAYQTIGGNLLSLAEVPKDAAGLYGVIDPGIREGDITKVRGLTEKPHADAAPSNLVASGRYIFQPEIFELLGKQEPGINGEIQLTDALDELIATQSCHGLHYNGQRFDCGSQAGFITATLSLALDRKELAQEVIILMQQILQKEYSRLYGQAREQSEGGPPKTTH